MKKKRKAKKKQRNSNNESFFSSFLFLSLEYIYIYLLHIYRYSVIDVKYDIIRDLTITDQGSCQINMYMSTYHFSFFYQTNMFSDSKSSLFVS